ncbi:MULTISPECIES: hypothetical protein [Streptomyces griseus group]|uniref:hypothetical protein n=1 Tax=Streptomyces griseus group TaxID=629295 RepID=UPI003432CAF7
MDYAGWNGVLAAHFFVPRERPVPVYLSVDDALLVRLAGTSNGATEDFERAVQSRVYGRDPFSSVGDTARRWRRDGGVGDPPFIAVLAATVLAASRMERTEGITVGRLPYYAPLRRLLGLGERTGGSSQMPENYDVIVPALWDHLAWWLDKNQQGRRGLSSAIPHPTQVHIGWALSQAVLQGADRAQLGLFLSHIGVQPGDSLPQSELLARFEEWTRVSHVSARIQRALGNQAMRAILASVLAQELAHFTGLAADATGLPCLPLALTSESGGSPYGLAVRLSNRFKAPSLTVDGAAVMIPAGAEWIPLPVPVDPPLPGTARDLDAGSARLMLAAQDCYILQPNELLGRWTSVSVAEVGVRHHVLVKDELAQQAVRVMRACGSDEPRRPRRAQAPPGWTLLTGYTPTRSAAVGGALGVLSPLYQQLARFSGGLQVRGGIDTYLLGYPPNLVLPGSTEAHPRFFTVDGRVIPIAPGAAAETVIVPLAPLGLASGEHNLRVRDRKLSFRLVLRYRERAFQPTLSLPPTGNKQSLRPVGIDHPGHTSTEAVALPADHVCGALLSPTVRTSLPTMHLIRRVGRLYALGRQRTAAELASQPPAWIEKLAPVQHSLDLDQLLSELPFTADWILRVSGTGSRSVLPAPRVRSLSARTRPGTSYQILNQVAWVELLSEPGIVVPRESASDWSRYLAGE